MKKIILFCLIILISACSQKNNVAEQENKIKEDEVRTEKLTMSDVSVIVPTESAGDGDKLLIFKVQNLSATNGKVAITSQSEGVYQTSTCKNEQNTILRASTSCEYKLLFNGSLKPSGNYIFSLFVKDVDSNLTIGAVSFNYYHTSLIDDQLSNPTNPSGSSLCKVGFHQEGRTCKNDIKPLIDPLKDSLKALSGYLQWNPSSRTYDHVITACQSSYTLNNNICELNLVYEPCTFKNAKQNGIESLIGVETLSGDVSNCQIDTCENGYEINSTATKCDVQLISTNLPHNRYKLIDSNQYLTNQGEIISWNSVVNFNKKQPIQADEILSVSTSPGTGWATSEFISEYSYIIYIKDNNYFLSSINNMDGTNITYNLSQDFGGVSQVAQQAPCFVNNNNQYYCYSNNSGIYIIQNSFGTISKVYSNGFVKILNKLYSINSILQIEEFSSSGSSTASWQISTQINSRFNNNEIVDIFHKSFTNNPWELDNADVLLLLTNNRIQHFVSNWSTYSNSTVSYPFDIKKIRIATGVNTSYANPYLYYCLIGINSELYCRSDSLISWINVSGLTNNSSYPITTINDVSTSFQNTSGTGSHVYKNRICILDQYNLPHCLYINSNFYTEYTSFMGNSLMFKPEYEVNYIQPVKQHMFIEPQISGAFTYDSNYFFINGSANFEYPFYEKMAISQKMPQNIKIKLIDSDYLCFLGSDNTSSFYDSISCQSDTSQYTPQQGISRYLNNSLGGAYGYSLSGMKILVGSASKYNTCVISEYNDVLCKPIFQSAISESNKYGQLGLGNTTLFSSIYESNTKEYEAVIGNGTFNGLPIQISLSDYHGCFLTSNNKIYCWGLNDVGQLGDGTITNKSVPTLVNLTNVNEPIKKIIVKEKSSCLITESGKGYCWGGNDGGQLGIGNKNQYRIPTEILLNTLIGSSKIEKIVIGVYKNTCSLISTGEIYCWGQNHQTSTTTNLIGQPSSVIELLLPQKVILPIELKDLTVTGSIPYMYTSSGTANISVMCGLTIKNERLCFGQSGKTDTYGDPNEMFNYGKGYPEKKLITPQ